LVQQEAMTLRAPAFWLDVAVKASLVGLLVFAVARPDLPQFHGKAMLGRAFTYPIAALIVPVAWWLLSRSRRREYPYALDVLLVLPFLIDVIGNAADLYDSIGWWDDLNHFVNWGILVSAFGQLLMRLRLERWIAAGLAVGFGALTAVLWEFAEYYTFIRNSPEVRTAYTDTLGDLALGLCGSVVAAVVMITLLWPEREAAPVPAPADSPATR
jgi:VanZ family protein